LYRTRDGGRNWLALGRPLPAGGVSAFAISRGEQGKSLLYLGGARGGVLISPVDDLEWQ
jgi:hypothetical protein